MATITVADLIDRVLRDFLLPPDSQPTRVVLSGDISDSDTTLTFDPGMLSAEEYEMMGPGSYIEIGSESILVGDIDEESNTLSNLIRGHNDTTPSSHTSGALISVAPIWPRHSIFEAVSDSILGLWPDLYAIDSEEVSLFQSSYTELPDGVMDVLSLHVLRSGSAMDYADVPFQFLYPFPPSSTNRAVFQPVYYGASGYGTFKYKFAAPTDEADTLADLKINQQWVRLIIIDTVAYLINTRDIDDVTEEFIDARISEAFPPGKGANLRDRLLNYHSYLMEKAKRTLRFENPTRTVTF